jgi:hypothetical protein
VKLFQCIASVYVISTFAFVTIAFVVPWDSKGAEEPARPSEISDNNWFIPRVTSLIRADMEAPDATIEILERSHWAKRIIKGSPRWSQTVTFHFDAYSPVTEQTLHGTGMTVFIYEQLTGETELMTPEDAGGEVKKRTATGSAKPHGSTHH